MNSRVKRRNRRGVSLPELLTVIALMGIIATIAVLAISGVRDVANEGFADDATQLVNRAVLHYDQVSSSITVAADNSSGTDELAVLALLKTDDDSIPGSPFLEPSFPQVVSNDTDRTRMVWNGTNFRVVLPGSTGTGILLNTD